MRPKSPISDAAKAAAKAYLAGDQSQRVVADRHKISLATLNRALKEVAAKDGADKRPAAAADPLERTLREASGVCAECARLRAMNGRLLRLLNELVTA